MAIPITRIIYLLGDGLEMEFGTLSDLIWYDKDGERCSTLRGEYSLFIFECLWGIKKRRDKKFIIESASLDSYEDGLKYVSTSHPLYIYTFRRVTHNRWEFILTEGYILYIEITDEDSENDPFYFTNHEAGAISFDEFFKNVFK